MKRDVRRNLKKLDGQDMEKTFGDLFIEFLMSLTEQDRNMDGRKKLERALLAERVHKAMTGDGEVEFNVNEAAMIKDLCGILGMPLVVLNVERFFED